MSAATRAALWAKERAELDAKRARGPHRLGPPRQVNMGKLPGKWDVVRVNDDGRREVVRTGLRYEHAAAAAGRMRDQQTDNDVGAGWNYLPKKR